LGFQMDCGKRRLRRGTQMSEIISILLIGSLGYLVWFFCVKGPRQTRAEQERKRKADADADAWQREIDTLGVTKTNT
jgi:hypothetical protein